MSAIATYHHLSSLIITCHHLFYLTYHHLSSPIITYHHLSSPIITYHHLSSPIITYLISLIMRTTLDHKVITYPHRRGYVLCLTWRLSSFFLKAGIPPGKSDASGGIGPAKPDVEVTMFLGPTPPDASSLKAAYSFPVHDTITETSTDNERHGVDVWPLSTSILPFTVEQCGVFTRIMLLTSAKIQTMHLGVYPKPYRSQGQCAPVGDVTLTGTTRTLQYRIISTIYVLGIYIYWLHILREFNEFLLLINKWNSRISTSRYLGWRILNGIQTFWIGRILHGE